MFAVYAPDTDQDSLWAINPDGTGLRQITGPDFGCPNLSPDGSLIAACGSKPGHERPLLEAELVDPESGAIRGLWNRDPDMGRVCVKWSPDGRRLGCEWWQPADNPTEGGLGSVRASDGGGFRKITDGPAGLDGWFGGYAPDGRSIVYGNDLTVDDSGLYVVRINGSHNHRLTPKRILVGSGGDYSPNGKLIAFSAHANAKVRQTIFVVRPDGTGLRRLAIHESGEPCGGDASTDPSAVGCTDPSWSPDGRELVFRYNTPDETDLQVLNLATGDVHTITSGSFADLEDWGPTPCHR